MKKLLCIASTLAVFVAVTFCFCISAFASTPDGRPLKNSGVYYKFSSATQTLVLSGEGDMPTMSYSTADIPWLDSGWDIQHVVVEDGITSVGNYAFYQMDADITLPESIKKIGKYSLAGANRVTNWVLPKSLETIGQYAFSGCSNLKTVTIDTAVSKIDLYAFNNCINLTSVKFESSVQTVDIGSYAFYRCPNLTPIVLPSNASLGTCSYGYKSTREKYENAFMQVYKNSGAYYYATTNEIPFSLIDQITLKCGTAVTNVFNDLNKNDEQHYTFIPNTTQSYVFYSLGDCDVMARLEKDGTVLATSNDVDVSNNGFCIKFDLLAGETYDLYVASERMIGSYTVYTYPAQIKSFSVVDGKISKLANEYVVYDNKKIFKIVDKDIASFTYQIEFADGSSYLIPYSRFIAGEYIKIVDTIENQQQNQFVCGINSAKLMLGNAVAVYPLEIKHVFEQTVFEPTEDDEGYTLNTCCLCRISYMSDFVESDAIIITGICYLSEHPLLDLCDSKTPYSNAIISVGNRKYEINSNGTWEIHTFTDCYAVFNNEYGSNVTIKIDISKAEDGVIDFGKVVLAGYDFNKDGYVNAKDFVIYRKEKYDDLGKDYWQFADEFIIKY